MDYTSRMVALLGKLRRERNGAVADAMRVCGTPYGLNYGVSLPTLREIARAETPDHDFARYLYRQEVRELRLAALHIACPGRLTLAEADAWAAGITNSEVAEETAFALLGRAAVLPELFRAWTSGDDPLPVYAALLAAARSPRADAMWAETAVGVVRRFAAAEAVRSERVAAGTAAKKGVSATPAAISAVTCASETPASEPSSPAKSAAPAAPACEPSAPAKSAAPAAPYAAHLVAQGAVALLAAVGARNEENRQAVIRAAGSLGKLPAEDFVHEELAWRLES